MTIARRRLAAHGLARPLDGPPDRVVAWLGALQAQNLTAARWAVGIRLASATERDVQRALDEGSILRTHALRGTWQLVTPADVRWLLALVAPSVIARNARRYGQLGLADAAFGASHDAVARALERRSAQTRRELSAAIEAAGVSTAGQRLAYLLQRAELDGLIVSGPARGRQATYALLDERAPATGPPLERDEALAELARRYVASRGPATEADFSWWSGLSAADARAGFEALGPVAVDDLPVGPPGPAAHLLPAFDEYLVGYRDRSAVLDAAHVQRVNAGGGLLGPTIAVDGRIVGTWRAAAKRGTVAVRIDPFDPLTEAQRNAVDDAIARYARFLGRTIG